MKSLEYKLVGLTLGLDMLSLMSHKGAIKTILMQSSALASLSYALQTVPINDESQNILGTLQALLLPTPVSWLLLC